MRDFLENLRYSVTYRWYSMQEKLGNIYDYVKFPLASLVMCTWGAFLGLGIYEGYTYVERDLTKELYVAPDVSKETLEHADLLIRIGSNSEAFQLLATHRNNFANEYTIEELEKVDSLLNSLVMEAEETTIQALYLKEDLKEVLPIYKFTGVVNAVDHDPLYGNTRTVSDDGSRGMEQVEVKGLTDAVMGSYVTFYGVPEFNGVDRPISVEAYIYVEDTKQEE